MQKDLHRLDLPVLKNLYIKEAREFLTAIEKGESWEKLESRRKKIRQLDKMIELLNTKDPITGSRVSG